MKKISFALTCLLLSACASVGVTPINPAPAREKGCHLDVYTNDNEVTRKFTPVCLIDAKTSTDLFSNRTMAGAIDKLRPAACKCGADAIVVVGGRSEGMTFFSNGQGFATVKAIKYTDGAAAK